MRYVFEKLEGIKLTNWGKLVDVNEKRGVVHRHVRGEWKIFYLAIVIGVWKEVVHAWETFLNYLEMQSRMLYLGRPADYAAKDLSGSKMQTVQ